MRFLPWFLASLLYAAVLPATVTAQSSHDYFPHEVGDRWTYDVRLAWGDTLLHGITTDVVSAVSEAGDGTRVTVTRGDTVDIRYRLSGDTIFVSPETVGLDAILDVIGIGGEGLIGDIDAFRLGAPVNAPWVLADVRRRVAVPEDLRDTLPADSVEVILNLNSRRLADEERSVPEGTYLTRVFESRLNLSIRMRIGLFNVTFDLIQNLPLRSYLAPGRGVIAQHSPSYDIRNPLEPEEVIFQIPAQEVEMASFQYGTSVELEGELPAAVTLHQNYPNPFNPGTTIMMALPEAMPVLAEVFDPAGRRIDVLADRFFGSGTHELYWNAAHRASGVYFLRVTTPERKLVLRMALVR